MRIMPENPFIDDQMEYTEFYHTTLPLYSIGINVTDFHLSSNTRTITIQGLVRPSEGILNSSLLPYSVGVEHVFPPERIQRWEWGNERWEIIPLLSDTAWWLESFHIRFVHVDNERIYLLLLPPSPKDQLLCRFVVLRVTALGLEEIEVNDYYSAFPAQSGEPFGTVAVGHNFIAFSRLGDFLLINLDTLQSERPRGPYLSDTYKRTYIRPNIRNFPMVIPEGFLFLPSGIFFDLETFYVLPHIQLPPTSDYIPIAAERTILLKVPRNRANNVATIEAALEWVDTTTGFERIEVITDGNFPPYAPWGEGVYWKGSWLAYGCDAEDLDERLIYAYQYTQNRLLVSRTPFPSLPLSSTAQLLRLLPSYADTYWLETYFQLRTNWVFVYTTRLWNRIYKIDPNEGTYELAFSLPIWTGNEYKYLEPEMPVQTFLTYDETKGQLYAISRYGHQNYLIVARQQVSLSPPPNPIDAHFDATTKTITFTPPVSAEPQEFFISIEHPPSGVSWKMKSWETRPHWQVSFDGGSSWQPMNGPVLRSDPETNLKVRVSLPQPLLKNNTYTVRVRTVSRTRLSS